MKLAKIYFKILMPALWVIFMIQFVSASENMKAKFFDAMDVMSIDYLGNIRYYNDPPYGPPIITLEDFCSMKMDRSVSWVNNYFVYDGELYYNDLLRAIYKVDIKNKRFLKLVDLAKILGGIKDDRMVDLFYFSEDLLILQRGLEFLNNCQYIAIDIKNGFTKTTYESLDDVLKKINHNAYIEIKSRHIDLHDLDKSLNLLQYSPVISNDFKRVAFTGATSNAQGTFNALYVYDFDVRKKILLKDLKEFLSFSSNSLQWCWGDKFLKATVSADDLYHYLFPRYTYFFDMEKKKLAFKIKTNGLRLLAIKKVR